jgi:hypothetical protein
MPMRARMDENAPQNRAYNTTNAMLQEETVRRSAFHFPLLVRLGQGVVHFLDPSHFGRPLGLVGRVGQGGDEVGDGTRGEELVVAVVQWALGERLRGVGWRRDLEDGLEDVDVI